LKQAAGTLGPDDLAAINSWLGSEGYAQTDNATDENSNENGEIIIRKHPKHAHVKKHSA
jgi:hypothetical protein